MFFTQHIKNNSYISVETYQKASRFGILNKNKSSKVKIDSSFHPKKKEPDTCR